MQCVCITSTQKKLYEAFFAVADTVDLDLLPDGAEHNYCTIRKICANYKIEGLNHSMNLYWSAKGLLPS